MQSGWTYLKIRIVKFAQRREAPPVSQENFEMSWAGSSGRRGAMFTKTFWLMMDTIREPSLKKRPRNRKFIGGEIENRERQYAAKWEKSQYIRQQIIFLRWEIYIYKREQEIEGFWRWNFNSINEKLTHCFCGQTKKVLGKQVDVKARNR